MFFGAAGFTFRYAEGLSYLSDDPHACINCHVMQEHFDHWRHASHGRVAVCNDCHVPHDSLARKFYVKAENGYRHSKGFTFQDFHEPIQITSLSREVVIENCMRCHSTIAADLTSHVVANYPASAASRLPSDCLHCHSRVGHGPSR
jgi:cytochrome c nitrite reductase small subunit